MNEEVVKEIDRRYNLLESHALPNSVSYGTTGSFYKFIAALNLFGDGLPETYTVDKKGELIPTDWSWADEKYLSSLVPNDDWDQGLYEDYLKTLHEKLMLNVNSRKKN